MITILAIILIIAFAFALAVVVNYFLGAIGLVVYLIALFLLFKWQSKNQRWFI